MSLPPFSPANALEATAVALADARAFWLSLAVERIVIDRVTGSEIDDEGREQNNYEVVYDGPGLAHDFMSHEQSPDVGGGTVTVQRRSWQIPVPEVMADLLAAGIVAAWAGPVRPGDRARLYADDEPTRTARIAGEHFVTHGVQQRLYVDDPTGGEFS